MMILQASEITKEFQGIPILTGVSFHVAGGERVGLVGANGCGKSTLMKILAGLMPVDGGTAHWVTAGISRAYLAQEGCFEPDRALGEQLGAVPDDLLARCGIGRGLLRQPAGSLSGGQKTRAALAKVLAGRPHTLLLDEPTNHLDTEGLAWLEALLTSYRGTVLVVSHDRYFLDKVATRILELDGGKVRDYPGNYTAYAAQKQAERERADAEYRQYVHEKKQLEAAIRRQTEWATRAHTSGPPPSAPKNWKDYQQRQAKAHMQVAKSMENRLEKIRKEKPRDAGRIHVKLEESGKVGKNLVLAERLGFTYDGRRWLFRSADFYVQRGDRVAITGPNGSGKTTLLRLLLGELPPTEGSLYRSPVRTAYLAQELELLDPARTVLEEATGNSALDQAAARTLLGCLLFQRDAVLKRVGALSGGEKVRLALAKILLSGPELLVLDEPTNNLDLASRERVEEALDSYPGTLFLVSHDRYLLRRMANRIIAVDGGKLVGFDGGYDQFVSRSSLGAAPLPADEDPAVRRLLLETQLARLSAQLDAPPLGEAEQLSAEFIRISRELRALRS